MSEAASDHDRQQVVVAVLTFRRNDELARLLPALVAEAASVRPAADVIVIDNDPAGGAEPTVRGVGVRYEHQPRPGIAPSRNRALDAAGPAGYLVFIDDDENPEPGWLAALTRTARLTGAAGVAGPVISDFEMPLDPWVQASNLFCRRRYATGDRVAAAATNNLLLDLTQTEPLRFDERFALLGGEDTLFTRTLVQQGKVIVWCDEAVVRDRVPIGRATPQWVRRRAHSMGNSEVAVALLLADSRPERLRIRMSALVGGGARLILGSARAANGRLTGRLSRRADGSRILHRGLGHLTAACGVTYAEYARETSPGSRLRRGSRLY